MVSFFPTPRPDELFYSLCARYSDFIQYSNRRHVAEDLFGSTNTSAVVDLPSHLGYFADSALPAGHQFAVGRLIDGFTLLPFYSPFLPCERYGKIKEAMSGTDSNAVRRLTGLISTNVTPPGILRYCPACVTEERGEYGECYWHRLHQLPGVKVCPDHLVFLEDSSVKTRGRVNSQDYVAAEGVLAPSAPRHVNAGTLHAQVLINVARDAAWILSQHSLNPGCLALRTSYLKVLTENGLALHERRVRVSKIVELFERRYPPLLLRDLQCDFDLRRPSAWPKRVIHTLTQRKPLHPLRHLIFIQLLGYSAERFFKRCLTEVDNNIPAGKALLPFGDGPWPCLNKASTHFRRKLIKRSITKYSRDTNIPTGTFSCTCGFVYSIKGPLAPSSNPGGHYLVRRYGPIWEEALRRLWENTSISINKIAADLGTGWNTVRYHAQRLRLRFPRYSCGRVVRVNPVIQKRLISAETVKLNKIKIYREKWLLGLAEHPGALRWHLKQHILPGVYCWLYKHDREWLQSNLPAPHKRVGSARPVEWGQRDVEIAAQVKIIGQQLKNAEGRPARVTRKAIIRLLPRPSWVDSKSLSKLPLTAQALTEVVETHFDFAVRRVWWIASCLAQENVAPSRPALLYRTGISSNILAFPEVRAAVNAAYHFLRHSNGRTWAA